MASASAVRAGEAFVQLSADDTLFDRAMARVVGKIRRTGEMLRRVGTQTAAVGAGLGAAMSPAVATFVRFDDAILQVKAVTGASADEFAKLREKALELGRTTSFTAGEVAALMTELGRAGFKPDEIDTMTASVLNLARATGTDAALAAGIMSATLRQFGLDARDAARAADALAATANKSFTSVESLGESLKFAGPVAADLGMSLEDTLALAGALGNVGIQGTEAGTAIRRIGILVAAGGEDLKRIFGVEAADAAGNMRPLIEVLSEVFESTKQLGNAERAAKFAEFFGLLGITGASALGKNAVGVKELREQLASAGGTAEKTAKEMDSGLGGGFRMLSSAVEGTAIAFAEALVPVIKPVAKIFEATAGKVTGWIQENKTAVVVVGALSAALVAVGVPLALLGVAIGGIGTALGVATGLVGVLGSALAGLGTVVMAAFSPIGLVVAGAVAAVYLFSDAIESAVGSVRSGLSGIADFFKRVFGGIASAIKKGDLSLAMAVAGAALKVAWKQVIYELVKAWDGFTNMLYRAWWGLITALQNAWTNFRSWLIKKMLDVFEFVVKPVLKATDALDITEGEAEKFTKGIQQLRDEVEKEREDTTTKRDLEFRRALDERQLRQLNDRRPVEDSLVDAKWELEQKLFEANLPFDPKEVSRTVFSTLLAELYGKGPGGPAAAEAARPAVPVRPPEERLADSVRGVFQSADFQGTLSIGPAAKDAGQQQVEQLKGIGAKLDNIDGSLGKLDKLDEISRKLEPPVWG